MRTIILDNEAVQALSRVDHRKHRLIVAHLSAIVARRKRGAEVRAVVPMAVRVEAGWSRGVPQFAGANRFRVVDVALDTATGNDSAGIVGETGVSVADAHVGAVARATVGEVVVLTSDPSDIRRASAPKTIVTVRV